MIDMKKLLTCLLPNSNRVARCILILIFFKLCITFNSFSALANYTKNVDTDTLPTNLDRHPLICVGGGYFRSVDGGYFIATNHSGIVAMLELEYSLDRNRDWNIEIIYYRLFYGSSGKTFDSGLLSFRRYLLSQEYVTRPSFHIGLGGLSIDIGAALDVTFIRRLLYMQLCLRVPVRFIGHSSEGAMPTILSLNTRIMF